MWTCSTRGSTSQNSWPHDPLPHSHRAGWSWRGSKPYLRARRVHGSTLSRAEVVGAVGASSSSSDAGWWAGWDDEADEDEDEMEGERWREGERDTDERDDERERVSMPGAIEAMAEGDAVAAGVSGVSGGEGAERGDEDEPVGRARAKVVRGRGAWRCRRACWMRWCL